MDADHAVRQPVTPLPSSEFTLSGAEGLGTDRANAQPSALSVLIPAHNEAGNLAPLMQKIAHTFNANHLCGEVVLVNDGSTDDTRIEADALAAQYSFLRVIHHRRNRGLTEALKTGFRTVRGEWLNNIEITHALQRFALPQFSLHQQADGALRFRFSGRSAHTDSIRQALLDLFGSAQPLELDAEQSFDGKVVQYTSDLADALP